MSGSDFSYANSLALRGIGDIAGDLANRKVRQAFSDVVKTCDETEAFAAGSKDKQTWIVQKPLPGGDVQWKIMSAADYAAFRDDVASQGKALTQVTIGAGAEATFCVRREVGGKLDGDSPSRPALQITSPDGNSEIRHLTCYASNGRRLDGPKEENVATFSR